MHIILSDDSSHYKFAPITLTRPLGELRFGIMTNVERIRRILGEETAISFETQNPHLNHLHGKINSDALHLNARFYFSEDLLRACLNLKLDETLEIENKWIAKRGLGTIKTSYSNSVVELEERWDLYTKNHLAISEDYKILTQGRISESLSETNTVIGDKSQIFLEAGAKVEASILNTNDGPIYIGKNAEVMEGSMIRGPFALCESAGVKMGAKIYGATTIGPHCKVGGEISNSILHSYSNKGHDGFLGNSYLGAWCNLGADTNTSNLKNNYGSVKTYSYEHRKLIQTELTFMGLFMGDHSKCSINTMFNTATTVGVSANIFDSGFPSKFVPSFTWGKNEQKFDFTKALEVAKAMMARRKVELSNEEENVLRSIFESQD